MGTFGDSWTLTKTSFRVIKEDKALLLFPLVSGLAMIGIIALFAVGFFSLASDSVLLSSNSGQALLVGMALALYFLLWIVSVYFQGALIGAAMQKLNGRQPTFSDGMRAAGARAGRLVAWALIAGTIMLLIRAISSRFRGITGALIGIAAGVAFGVLTYFIIPVIMFEDIGAWKSLKRSGSLFVNTFGRTFLSNLALGLILAAGFILGIVALVAGIWMIFTVTPALLGVIVAVAGFAFLVFMAILASAAEGVLVAALYRFATTGQATAGMIPPQYLAAQPLPSSGLNAPLNFGSFSNSLGPSSSAPPPPPPPS